MGGEISGSAERWDEQCRNLIEHDRGSAFFDSWKMIALEMILGGEASELVERRENEFKTYKELQSVAMKWTISHKIQNERTQDDPVDCSHVPWSSAPDSEWRTQEDRKSAADAARGPSAPDASIESPTDVNCAQSEGKGKGRGDGYSQGSQGHGNHQTSVQYRM